MASKKCPACGKEAEGRFCSWCGASLGGARCGNCGEETEPGARFCNACGSPLGGAAGGGSAGGASEGAAGSFGGSRAGWWVAGVLMIGAILIVALPNVLPEDGGVSGVGPGAAATGQGGVPDIASMSPRQAADQLYNRIMSTAEAGDSAGAAFFLPMGIQAYDRARPLDADGLFHLSLLQGMSGDPESALATAREALAAYPTHLLNLAAAGRAALGAGDTTAAEEYYGTFLEAYDEEMAKGVEEYELHSGMMPELRGEAEEVTGG